MPQVGFDSHIVQFECKTAVQIGFYGKNDISILINLIKIDTEK